MRILYLEDNPLDADLTQRALFRDGGAFDLVHAGTLREARTHLAGGPAFDLALLDLQLPDGSGMELLAEIRRAGMPVAVVVLTGSGDQTAAISALQAGADDYVCKAADTLKTLPAALRSAWKRHHDATKRRTQPLRILYVEHTPADIDLTKRHLARFAPHLHMTSLASAEEALAILPMNATETLPFDVLLLDYRLPGADALEALKCLRTERSLEIPVVIVSGQGSEEIAAQAIYLGADAYLSKHQGYLYELPATLEKVFHQTQVVHERRNLRAAGDKLEHVLAASPTLLFMWHLGEDGPAPSWVSTNIERLLGYTQAEALNVDWWQSHLHPKDSPVLQSGLEILMEKGEFIADYRFFSKSGEVRWIHDESRVVKSEDGTHREIVTAWRDITESKLVEQLREARTAVLDGVAAKRSLESILLEIATRLETLYPVMRVSILIRDPHNGKLYTGAAPSLPTFFNQAVDGLEPGIGIGSCGTAAATGEPVIVEDIRTHPYWVPFLALAEAAGVRSCWSMPFKNDAGRVEGTFGLYYAEPRSPVASELAVMGEFARIAGLAVERVRADIVLRQAAAVFESTSEGVVITDLVPTVLQVNRAYTEITGYGPEEAVGYAPRLISSAQPDSTFYDVMWAQVRKSGQWRGEVRNRRKSGEVFPQILTISTVRDPAGLPTHYVGVLSDISQIEQSEARLQRLAHFDTLTELPNRTLLKLRLDHALEVSTRGTNHVAALLIDVDRFKRINDSLGHPTGDEALKLVVKRMSDCIPEGETLGRLGGDEFLVILEHLEHPGDAATVANAIMEALREPIVLDSGNEVFVTCSVGISVYPDDASSSTELVQHADAAMYLAKEHGRDRFRYYTAALTAAANLRLMMDSRMRRGFLHGEFVVYYQPQVDIESGRIDGCEALVRWNDPERGLVPPGEFIGLAEETGFIVTLGEWVLRTACHEAMRWARTEACDLSVSVNLSGRQLWDGKVVEQVATILDESGLPPHRLKLELTESILLEGGVDGIEAALRVLNALHDLGVILAIDDFGTGYSSLQYLHRYPIDELKIDQSFVRGIPDDERGKTIAISIIALARPLRAKVVAEGVETEDQLAFLRSQGCHGYQGYLRSPAVPAEAFIRLAGIRL